MRTLSPFGCVFMRTRGGLLVFGSRSITFDIASGASIFSMPPAAVWVGFLCFVTRLTLDTTILAGVNASPAMISSTSPVLPLSLPEMTTTVSFFLILNFMALHDLRGERDDLQEFLVAQLASDGPEHAGALRLVLVVDQAGGVVVEGDVGAVGAAQVALDAHHDRLDDRSLLDRAVGQRVDDGADDDVAEARVLAVAAAHHVEALQLARAGVVGDVEHGSKLDHVTWPRRRAARPSRRARGASASAWTAGACS